VAQGSAETVEIAEATEEEPVRRSMAGAPPSRRRRIDTD
jgi:hypothetical protein